MGQPPWFVVTPGRDLTPTEETTVDGQLKILSMWAFIALDADGTEGLVAVELPGLGQTPLVGADLAMVAKLRPLAQRVADTKGIDIKLIHFSTRTEQEVIRPARR